MQRLGHRARDSDCAVSAARAPRQSSFRWQVAAERPWIRAAAWERARLGFAGQPAELSALARGHDRSSALVLAALQQDCALEALHWAAASLHRARLAARWIARSTPSRQ